MSTATPKPPKPVKPKSTTPEPPRLKVSGKGGLSVYGLGRFPVTLYQGQWIKLLAEKEAILAFIAENQATLNVKAPAADAGVEPEP